jgi:hypothetical protein
MSALKDRITSVGQVTPMLNVIGKDYNDVKMIPTVRIQIFPGVLLYDELQPIITADGAPISATGPGTWGQLFAAGTRGR